MYQCQMAKQTMGVPATPSYSDLMQLYRLHSPQRPMALTSAYDKFAVDAIHSALIRWLQFCLTQDTTWKTL